MQRSHALILAIAIVVALGGLAWWSLRSPRLDSGLIQRDEPTAQRPLAKEELEAPVEPEAAPRETVSAAPTIAPDALVSSPASTDAAKPILEGTLVVIDTDGVERRHEDGSLQLFLFDAEVGHGHDVDVHDGRWSCALDAAEGWSVGDIHAGGKIAVDADAVDRQPIPADRKIEIRARWAKATVLRVIDRDTRAALRNVDVKAARGWEDDARVPSSEAITVFNGVDSPITLAPKFSDDWRDLQSFFVRAPGYAWERVRLALREGGEHTVELEAGGDANIDVQGLDASRANVLRLRRDRSSKPIAERELRKDVTVHFESLALGHFRATVEIGDWWKQPLELGAAEFDVSGANPARATIVVAAAPELVDAQLAGTLTIPAEWKLDREPSLSIELIGSTHRGGDRYHSVRSIERDPEREGTWKWDAGKVETGWYEIDLFKPPYKIAVEVGPEGRRDVAFVVPAPVQVAVRVLDDRTSADAALERCLWHPKWPDRVSGGVLENMTRDAKTGFYEFLAPAGTIAISWSGETFAHTEVEIEATAPRSEHVLRAKPATSVVVELLDEQQHVSIDGDDRIAVDAVGHKGMGWQYTQRPRGPELRFTAGGRYRITVPAIHGFEKVPPFDLDVVEGESVHHEVRLVRKP